MEKTFWLLDVNYEVRYHKPELWIWSIDEEGKRLLIIDQNFLPYFYFITNDQGNPKLVMEKILSRKSNFPFILRLEPLERKFFGLKS